MNDAINKALQRLDLPGLAVMALCAGLWELYCRTLGASFGGVTSALATVVAAKDLLIDGPLAEQLWHTASVTILGWIIASALGFVIGLVLGLSRTAWTYSMAGIEVLARSVHLIRADRRALLRLLGRDRKW